jgi:hypothetical protein
MTFWHSRIGLTGSDGRWLKNELVIERDKAPVTAVQPQTVAPGIVTPSRSRVTPILLTASWPGSE